MLSIIVSFFILALIAYLSIQHNVYVPPGPKWYTRVANYINFISFMCSTLLILSMTFERFYSIILPHKAASFNTVKRAKITVACIVIVSILYNIPHLYVTSNVKWEYIPYGNSNEYSFGEFYYWLSTIVHFALPFTLLLIMNSVIIHKIRNRFPSMPSQKTSSDSSIRESSQGESSQNKKSELQVFVTLLLVTFTFLILTTPAYLFFFFVLVIDFFKTPRCFAGYFLFYNVSHKLYISNYGINFFLYVISGKKFRTDLRNIFPDFKKRKRTKQSLSSITDNVSISHKTN